MAVDNLAPVGIIFVTSVIFNREGRGDRETDAGQDRIPGRDAALPLISERWRPGHLQAGVLDRRGRASFPEHKGHGEAKCRCCGRRQEVSALQTGGASSPGRSGPATEVKGSGSPGGIWHHEAQRWPLRARSAWWGQPFPGHQAAPGPRSGSPDATAGTTLRVCLSEEYAQEFGVLSFHIYI